MHTIKVEAEITSKYVRNITILFLVPMSGEPPLQLIDYAYAASDDEYRWPMDEAAYVLLRKLSRAHAVKEPGVYVCHSQLLYKPGSKWRVSAALAKESLRKVHAIDAAAHFHENFGPKKPAEYLDIQIYADSHLGKALTALSDHWGITIPSVIEDALSVECVVCAENFIPTDKDPTATDPYAEYKCGDCLSLAAQEEDDEDDDLLLVGEDEEDAEDDDDASPDFDQWGRKRCLN